MLKIFESVVFGGGGVDVAANSYIAGTADRVWPHLPGRAETRVDRATQVSTVVRILANS
jgi:hypothetical protein